MFLEKKIIVNALSKAIDNFITSKRLSKVGFVKQ